MMRVAPSILGFIAIFLPLSARADEWPQFRGPQNNNLIGETDLPLTWSADKHLGWNVEIPGRAWSSPIIWGDRVFVTTCVQEQTPTSEDRRIRGGVYRWEVHCLDFGTGKTLWKRIATQGEPRNATHSSNTYASETPVTDGKRVYAYFGMTGLFAYDFEGDLVWKKDLGAYPMERDWGTSSSPLIYRNRIYLQVDSQEDSFLVALDAKTGDRVWRMPRDEGSNWSTPIIWKNRKRVELVTAGKKTRSYDPATGKLLWELNLGGGRCSASPTANDELLYVGSEGRSDGGGSLFAVKAGASGEVTPPQDQTSSAGVLWSRANAGIGMASPLVFEDLVYIAKRRAGVITTYNAKTGEEIYQKRLEGARAFWATPWAYGGRVYFLDDGGTVHALRPGPEFEVLARNSIAGEFWASPAIAREALILRGLTRLYCIRQ
jgi:outer membrane protein assembly factor BamB